MLILRPCATFRSDLSGVFILRAQLQQRRAEQTGEYVRTVVTQMVSDKTGMVLKHFPGYGNNADTHTGIAIDERPMDTFRQSDFRRFQAGY